MGHKGDVTAVATSSENPDMILTASRDKTIIMSVPPLLRPRASPATLSTAQLLTALFKSSFPRSHR